MKRFQHMFSVFREKSKTNDSQVIVETTVKNIGVYI